MNRRDLLHHPATLVAAVLLVVLGAATATTWRFALPDWAFGPDLSGIPQPEAPDAPPPSLPPPPEDTPSDNDTVATILLVLAALAVAALLWYAARKIITAVRAVPHHDITPDELDTGEGLTTAQQPTVPLPELADAVTRALAHLDDARTPTDGVIAAWIALEDAAAEHGTHRDPAQTTTEFTRTVLDATPAPPTDLDTLRRLYQRARFTHHPVTADDVESARTALTTIARSLELDPHQQTPERPTAQNAEEPAP